MVKSKNGGQEVPLQDSSPEILTNLTEWWMRCIKLGAEYFDYFDFDLH